MHAEIRGMEGETMRTRRAMPNSAAGAGSMDRSPGGRVGAWLIAALVAWAGPSVVAEAQGPESVEDHAHPLHIEIPLDPDEDEVAEGQEAGIEYQPAAEEDEEEEAPDANTASFTLYGNVWLNYAIQPWLSTPAQQYGGFSFNQARLGVLADWRGFSMHMELRFFTWMIVMRQAWIQYEWEDNAVQAGLIQRPWGRQPWSSDSWWFTLGWYVGLADDYDLGVKYTKDNDRYRLDVMYSVQDAAGFLDPTARWATDLTPSGEQQNRQFSTGSARFLWKFQHGEGSETRIGAFGSIGLMQNAVTGENGNRWYAGATYHGDYDGWRPLVQFTRQEFNPNNPDEVNGVQVDDRVVRVSQFVEFRDMAAKAWLFNVNLAKHIPFNRKYLQALVPYIEWSWFMKDEDDFADSHLITPGLQIQMYNVWLWFDILIGRNAVFMNDSPEQSGIGAGGIRPDRFEVRPNLQIQFYF